MILDFYSKPMIDLACNLIRSRGEEPIIYVSSKNIEKMSTADIPSVSPLSFRKGYISTYRGTEVYLTDQVADSWVIVPKYQKEK